MADFEQVIYPGQGGMNRDASYNVLPEGDYPYALNCISDETGEYGMITNIKGNEVVTFTLPAGTNKVVGFTEDAEDQAGIYMVYNSNGDHCIVRYYSLDDSVEFILDSESVLNFQLTPSLDVEIIGSGNDKLLFWTGDEENPPRKINLMRAYRLTNTTTTTTTTTT